MDIFGSDPSEDLAMSEEEDAFYEGIEAPKFVDLTIPDRSKPDDKSWFCLRIGCDLQHEQVDPDALYRSFLLRVMSARSPNVKFQKALNRPVPRSIKKCPRTAPAKSVKDRVSRMSTMTSIPDKLANSKLKYHPISSLQSTPNDSKSKVQPVKSEKKALTTPKTRKCPINAEPFRSVKQPKTLATITKNQSAAKSLFLGTPKKNDKSGNLLTPQVCDGMKKLNMGTQKKHTPVTPRGRLNKSSRCRTSESNHLEVIGRKKEGEVSSMSLKKRKETKEAEISTIISNHCVEETILTSVITESTDSNTSEEKENIGVLQELSESDSKTVIVTENDSTNSNNSDAKEDNGVPETLSEPDNKTGVIDAAAEYDDNKENDSSVSNINSGTTNPDNGSLQVETRENIPPKVLKAANKKIQEHVHQEGKMKRTTILKPFRLRTDERGILKQTILEKKVQLEAIKETVPVVNHGYGKLQNGKAILEKNQTTSDGGQKAQTKHGHETNQISSDMGQKAKPNQTRFRRVRFVESRYATSIPKYNKAQKKDTEESQKDVAKKTASARQIPRAQSVMASRTGQVSQLSEKAALATKARTVDNRIANATCSKGIKPLDVLEKSTRFNVPKKCTRRQAITIP